MLARVFQEYAVPTLVKMGSPMGHTQNKQNFLAEITKQDHRAFKSVFFYQNIIGS